MDRQRSLLSCLLLGIAALAFACGSGDDTSSSGSTARRDRPADPQQQPAGFKPLSQPSDKPAHPIFGQPLEIDGEEISNEQIKRFLVLGPHGNSVMEARILNTFIDAELERRAAAGEDTAQYDVPDEEIDNIIAAAEQSVAEQFNQPTPVGLKDVLTKGQQKFLRPSVRTNKRFDRIFIPDNPYEWPEVTLLALRQGSVGEDFIDKLKENWDERVKKEAEQGTPITDVAGQEFINSLLRGDVVRYLQEQADIVTADEGLPDTVALRVDGQDIMIADVWGMIEDLITVEDVKQAKQWIVNTRLIKKALQAEGHFLSDEAIEQIYKESHDPYKDSPFSLERVATTYRKFPSVWDYRTHYHMLKSFEKKIEDEINDDVLQERADRLDLLIAGRVDVDVILISAYDFEKREWKPNGWEDAQALAMQVTRELSQGLDWDEAVEKYSEFYDPPQAMAAQAKPKNKGRFRMVTRAELREHIEESDYSTFLNSASVADFVFFYQEMGTTNQPLIGPYGYYIPRMLKRILPGRTISLDNDNHRDLLVQEYVTTRFNQWVYDLRQQADLRGMPATAY